ncbi:ribonuclease T1 [Sphaerosporella brunnea]|uniref:ribonuclease T1 n=1 Tax=Sphaerosporella brunnea TaxID=1250544 RepID=A0A5J5EEY8_9PEZI|nr:ribonuclease T1 [Sphaerosporella brunnea]
MYRTLLAAASLLFAAAAASAASVTGVTGADCNGYAFAASAVQAASNAAIAHIADGTTASDYPHQYNNYEGFTFNAGCNPPYYEFPVFKSQVYTGGSPGADRVVVGSVAAAAGTGVFCDVITHHGASGNAFLLCDNV